MLTNLTTRRQMIFGAAVAFGGVSIGSVGAWASVEDGISHTAESIHQEPVLTAGRKRVYETLVDPKQFDQVVKMSGVLQAMKLGDKPSEISPEVGGAFVLFGGYITGRHLEMKPGERLVQAWRAGSWGPGMYSIARFELKEEGAGTRIVFDHSGFPAGEAQSLAGGWKAHYWEPMAKYLG